MVSTRQMVTSSGHGSSNHANDECSSTLAAVATRATVVTRQYSNVTVTRHQQATKGSLATTTMQTTTTTSTATTTSTNNGSGLVEFAATSSSSLHLHDLPLEILSKILCYESYKRLAQLRLVSHKFNEVCMYALNSTFSKLLAQTYNRFQAIKAKMPRRESLRRQHPLACECDILETCNMRLSLLQMTLGKHIERGHCCFFPAAILDEVYSILAHIRNTPSLERPYRVTDELFDLSTMAMEYFRDQIEPTLPGLAYFQKNYCRPAVVISAKLSESATNSPSPPQSNMVLRKGIRKIKQGMKIYNNQLSLLRNELRTCKRKSTEQSKQIAEQQKLLAEQQKQTLEYANRLDENDKKNEEIAHKFSTLLQELNKCKTELQYWRSKSPAMPTCSSCGQKLTTNALYTEDYQTVIHQNAKTEDKLNNELKCETPAESMNQLTAEAEFVFPDEVTTAKLLAINTVNKQLKREYGAISDATTSTSQVNNTSAVANVEQQKFCELNNCFAAIGSSKFDAGFAPTLFYGNLIDTAKASTSTTAISSPGAQHSGVIVSPCALLAQKFPEQTADLNATEAVDNVAAQAAVIMPPESKKARRVQKAARCLSAVGGKRSK